MWRRALCAAGAILLWCASAIGAESAVAAPSTETARPPLLQLGQRPTVSLTRNSVYWLDLAGHHTVQQVEAEAESLPWRTRRRDSQGPVHDGALWIRFEASVPPGERWFVEVAAPFHDRVQLSYRDASGAWVTQESGTNTAVSAWAVP